MRTSPSLSTKQPVISRRELRLTSLVAALALGGCAVTPVPLTTAEAIQQGLADRALLMQEQQAVTGVVDLNQAIARALKYNRERRVQLMETVINRNQLALAHFDMLPQLSASAGYSQRDKYSASASTTFDNGEPLALPATPTYSVGVEKESDRYDLGLSWNVLDFGLSYVRAGQQANRVLIAQERERKAIHNLIQEVRTSYWRAVSAQRLLQRVTPLQERVNQALADSRQIETLRLKSPLDALTYQRDLLDIRRTLEGFQKDLLDARTSLTTLMGLPPGAVPALKDMAENEFKALDVQVDVETLERTALARRPELVESRYQTRIAQKEGRAALLALLPRLNLSAGVHSDSNQYLLFNDWKDYGATLSLNLFNVFKAPAVRQQSDSQNAMAEARRLALTAAVIGQVHMSRIAYEQARLQFTTATEFLSVVQRIRQQMAQLHEAERGGALQLIREELSEMVAELRRDVAYAELQNGYGRIFISAGLDPLPPALPDDSLDTLSLAVADRFEAWKHGEVGLVATPLDKQISPWKGPGEHQFAVSADTFVLGGAVQYQATQADGSPLPAWAKFDPQTQVFSGNPPATIGEVAIKLSANNDTGTKAHDQFTLKLDNVNDAPVVDTSAPIQVTEDDAPIQGQIKASDPDGDPLSFAVAKKSELPAGFSMRANGSWTFDARAQAWQHLKTDAQQTAVVNVDVSDPHSGTTRTQLVFQVSGQNDAPVFSSPMEVKVTAGADPVQGQLTVTDADDDSSHQFATLGSKLPNGFSLREDGSWQFDPGQDEYRALQAGSFQALFVPVKATDERGAMTMGRIQITVMGAQQATTSTDQSQETQTQSNVSSATLPVEGKQSAEVTTKAAANVDNTETPWWTRLRPSFLSANKVAGL